MAFDFHPLLTLPIVQDRKWIKKASLFEPKASFEAFPFFVLLNWEAEGQWQRGRLSLLTCFGEAKKVSGRRATPGQRMMKFTKSFRRGTARVSPALHGSSNVRRENCDSP